VAGSAFALRDVFVLVARAVQFQAMLRERSPPEEV
jgi:hypothetical protein